MCLKKSLDWKLEIIELKSQGYRLDLNRKVDISTVDSWKPWVLIFDSKNLETKSNVQIDKLKVVILGSNVVKKDLYRKIECLVTKLIKLGIERLKNQKF